MTEVLDQLGTELADAVWGFRRVARRVVRETFPGEALPPSEAELLWYVGRARGVGVSDAARALQLAPNTVSTLVGRLVREGLLERLADPGDRRAARLQLTAAGTTRVNRWRRHRAEVLERALRSLSGEDATVLESALPVLRTLTTNLESLGTREPG